MRNIQGRLSAINVFARFIATLHANPSPFRRKTFSIRASFTYRPPWICSAINPTSNLFFPPLLSFLLPSRIRRKYREMHPRNCEWINAFDNEICIRRGFEQKIWLIKFSKQRKCVKLNSDYLDWFERWVRSSTIFRFLDSFVSIFNRGLFIWQRTIVG